MTQPVCVVPAGDWTGEGCVWHARERALYWVDINRFLIHRFNPESRATWSWLFDEPPVALGLTSRPGTLVVALASKVILWQPQSDSRFDFAAPDLNWPYARFNDGRPDPAGYFWLGSMQRNVGDEGQDVPITDEAAGRLFRIAGDGSATLIKTGIGIANTVCWSPDRTHFYFGDTVTNVVAIWDYDEARGTVANERPFFSEFGRGQPDGSAVDSEGFLWNARYGGGCVVRVSPEGDIDRIVDMPVGNITTCTFGGPDLKTLYITTARGGSGAGERLAGSLYAYPADVPGLPENMFRLD